ncbi:DUF6079 family protein [Flexilinea flocculi]|uniref:ATPase n=1 Tax=Flexilinea flocculi TaxID=1678840 RepID=A0A0S7BVD8_9CHLR|nr:DUF6079 family protein [Flexilinea flocculi]GAP40681.1 hypothetical protein ATC1_13660 [Flexilinea flocculi]
MLYRDLVQFTPIETIIQLRDAEKESTAKSLVQSYVISDAMANKLIDMVFPQLQFERPQDNKGVLIVGNYGTGKSHLMSVISSIAERAELKDCLTNEKVKNACGSFAGKFKVIRVEIGSVTRGLREILLDEIQSALHTWEISFIFPSADQITNNKTSIIQAMAVFQEKFPGMGLLLAVDELLDYLRTREQHALILDLGFLRELGEVAASCPFRFIGGLQETLFENPRFSFVAEQLRRVKHRFEPIDIAREDITYVVSQRLLKKTDAQKARITDHLRTFAPLYKAIADRLDEFVDLFPIHPVYVETFENLAIAEKRQVLKTFSTAIRSVLDQEVPADQPGLISYDQYWKLIQDDPSLRSIDDIARVIQKSNILEGLIQNAYTRPNLKDMAIRIIRALSVQRLTTSDIFVSFGVTAEGLRDGLCLFQRLPAEMNNADFLLDQVQVALREIMKTVQGQFLSYNSENGQYYLDLKKAVDFDQKIHERGDFMDKSDINIYFYNALRQALNLSDTTYLTGYSIWFYELPWSDHKVTRPGYLFFGPPDERTTAQPPRDFYIYFLPPFQSRTCNDQKLPDEALFYLAGLDHEFEEKIRLYAGARAMANESTEYRTEYANKADTNFRSLMHWLQTHLVEKLHVIYQGVDEPIYSVLTRMRGTASTNIEELIRLISSHLFSSEFEDRYPDYPRFNRLSQPVTETARANSAMEAIRCLCGRTSNLGSGVLEGLGILDGQGSIHPYDSPYSEYFLKLLNDKPDGQVINRGEVIDLVSGGIQPVEKDLKFNLEPEWVSVILLSLVYNGDIVLSLDGREELDAGSLERAMTRSMIDITNFRFFKRPRTLPINLWILIFEGLGLQPGLIRDENTRENAVTELQRLVHAELEMVVKLQNRLEQGIQLWNTPIFTDRLTFVVEQGTVVGSDAPEFSLSTLDLLPGLRGYKQFLEELSKYTIVGKLRNLRYTSGQIQENLNDRQSMQRASQLLDAVMQIQPYTSYLAEAQANLPEDHEWSHHARQVQKDTLDSIRRLGKGSAAFDQQAILRDLAQLKQEYIAVYSDLHRKSVLTASGDDLRQRLYRDARFESMRALSAIELLTRSGDFEFWKQQLTGLVSCREFHEGVLTDSPTCPYCHLRPAQQRTAANSDALVHLLDAKLSDLLKNWRKALCDNLNSDTAQHSLEAMSSAERKPVEAFLQQGDDAEGLPSKFIPSAIQALRGIQTVTLAVDSLLQALKNGGLPCTREELQNRFKQYLDQQMRGHDAGNTRLTLDQ